VSETPIDARTERTPWRAIVFLSFAAFASQAMVRVTDPLLPQIAQDIGTTVGAASIVVTAYGLAHGITQGISSPLGDRFRKYRLVGILAALTALMTLACGFATDLQTLTLARLGCGMTAGMIIPLGMAFVGDVVPYERRQSVLGRFLTGQITGLVSGQIAGGVLGDFFGWRSVFFLLAALFALTSILIFLEIRRDPSVVKPATDADGGMSLADGYRAVFTERWPRIVIFAAFLEGALMFGTFAYVGADLNIRLGLSFSAVGAVLAAFGVGGLLYVASVKLLVRHLGERRMVLTGSVLLCAGYLALAFGHHWAIAFGAIVITSLGFYMVHNTLQVHATQMSPQARATAVGVFSSALYLGMSADVAAAAPFFDRLGALPIYLTAAFVFPLLALCLASLLKKREGV